MISILEAISPTARVLLGTSLPEAQFFACGYKWHQPGIGDLEGTTVISGVDAEAALQHFRSTHRQLTDAWIINPQPAPQAEFVRRRAFLKK